MNLHLDDNPYLLDLLQQPEALQATLDWFTRQTSKQFHPIARNLVNGRLKRVVLTGMGASYSALLPLRLTLIAAGIPTNLVETSELIHFAPRLLAPEALVIIVSQSGRSIETLQLLERLPKDQAVIGVTNSDGSPLGQCTDALLVTRAGAEHSVSCKTYVTALAMLALLGDLLTGRNPADTVTACRTAADRMARYLSGWQAMVSQALEQLADIQSLIVTGRGPSLAAVGTGSLIIKEAAHFHAEGLSSAAFRHGPIELISLRRPVLVFFGLGSGRSLNASLVADIRTAGGRAELIGPIKTNRLYRLPNVPPVSLPLVEILPMQMISIALAVINNHTPGRFTHGAKVTQVP